MTYDKKCYNLAQAFLCDVYKPGPLLDEAAHELAQQIQNVIEDFMSGELPIVPECKP